MESNKIGKSIITGLARKQITQSSLARSLNVDKSLVNKWIKGDATPGGENLLKIIGLLEIHDLLFPDRFLDAKESNITRSEIDAIWKSIEEIKEHIPQEDSDQ